MLIKSPESHQSMGGEINSSKTCACINHTKRHQTQTERYADAHTPYLCRKKASGLQSRRKPESCWLPQLIISIVHRVWCPFVYFRNRSSDRPLRALSFFSFTVTFFIIFVNINGHKSRYQIRIYNLPQANETEPKATSICVCSTYLGWL